MTKQEKEEHIKWLEDLMEWAPNYTENIADIEYLVERKKELEALKKEE